MYYKTFREHFRNQTKDFGSIKLSCSQIRKLCDEFNQSIYVESLLTEDEAVNQFLWNSTKFANIYNEKTRMSIGTAMFTRCNTYNIPPISALAPQCVPGVPAPEQEGNNPMRYDSQTVSAISVAAPVKSDTAIQREYLIDRLYRAYNKKKDSLRGTFNLDTSYAPKTYADLIAKIKADDYTLDQKKIRFLEKKPYGGYDDCDDEYIDGSVLSPFIWNGPAPDRAGYDAAVETLDGQYYTAKDAIMVKDGEAGLSAIQALEAWTPTTAAN